MISSEPLGWAAGTVLGLAKGALNGVGEGKFSVNFNNVDDGLSGLD